MGLREKVSVFGYRARSTSQLVVDFPTECLSCYSRASLGGAGDGGGASGGGTSGGGDGLRGSDLISNANP